MSRPTKRGWCLAVTGLFFAVYAPCVSAQQVSTGFSSDVSRYVWTAGLRIDQTFGIWHLDAASKTRSEAFLLDNRVTEWRDENLTSFLLRRSLNTRLEAVAYGRGTWFSQNQASTQEAYAGIRTHPIPELFVEPAVGLVLDRKPGFLLEGQSQPDVLLDGGVGISLRGAMADKQVGQFVLAGQTVNRWHFISPRFGRSMLTEASAQRDLEGGGSLRMEVRYANLRRDAYQSSSFLNRNTTSARSDDTIEATTSDTMDTRVRFDYPIWGKWTFHTDTRLTINDRYIRTRRAPAGELFFDTNFNRKLLDLKGRISYDTDVTSANIAASRSITEERRRLSNAENLPPAQATQRTAILRQADFDRDLFTLQGMYSTALSHWLSFRSSLRASILRHDTPELNSDDRDESSFDGDASLRFHVRKGLDVDLRLFGLEHHTVFLNASRSGENNRRRSLRFRPGMRWRPSRATDVRLETEVRAVYTTDDFSIPNQPKNDQSARELKYIGSIKQRIAPDASIHLDGSFSELLLGRLLWEGFRELPYDTLTTTTASAGIRIGRRVIAETGLRYFTRSDYERSLTVQYVTGTGNEMRTESITRPGRERLLQIGPTTELSFPMTHQSELRISGWIQFQRVKYTLYGDLSGENADAIRRAANRVQRRTIPNLLMTLVWNL